MPYPLLLDALPREARQMVMDDVLDGVGEMDDATLGLKCEAHLASMTPDELLPLLTDDDVGRLTELLRDLQPHEVA